MSLRVVHTRGAHELNGFYPAVKKMLNDSNVDRYACDSGRVA